MKYLNLASGAAHFKSPNAALKKTIAALENNETFYGEIAGLPALREAVSKRYREDYHALVLAENVLITAGTKQALFNIFSVLLKPGDEVIIPEPAWFGFTEILNLLQVKAVFLETKQSKNYDIAPGAIEALITDKTRLFIFSNPGNPTGRIYNKSEVENWLDILKKYPQIKILSDEIYDLIVFDNAEIPSLTRFPGPEKKHIIVNGFSKNFGMSGWRIGYLIAPENILKECVHFQQTTISGVNPFIQEGAVATLETRKDFLPPRIAELTRNREILASWLENNPEIKFFLPQAAYYIFADLRGLFEKQSFQEKSIQSSQEFCDHVKENFALEFQPGEKFNAPGFIRITFAVPESDLKEALSRLDVLLKEPV